MRLASWFDFLDDRNTKFCIIMGCRYGSAISLSSALSIGAALLLYDDTRPSKLCFTPVGKT